MTDRVSERTGEILPIHAVRSVWALRRPREYVKEQITKPRRAARRIPAVGEDPDEQRAAQGIQGTLLERIVFKRLSSILGPPNIAFIYKYQLGAATGVDARTFIGGTEVDFVVLNRPSDKQMALEILGAHWHGPAEQYKDTERALKLLALGFDYGEIQEWEIMMGDDYLDRRLSEVIGLPISAVSR